jgi:hypothetical protein
MKLSQLSIFLLIVILLAACAPAPATDVALPTPAANETKVYPTKPISNAPEEGSVLTWERSGGIAGFCDKVVVYASGSATVSSCKGSETTFELNGTQREQLDAWLKTLKSVEFTQSDPAVADAMSFSLFFTGNGTQAADEETTRLIFKFAAELQDQASTLVTAPPEMADAEQALRDYFTALNSGDYILAAKLYGGKLDLLQTWNPDIENDLPALFERACTQNGLVCMEARTVTYRGVSSDGNYEFFVEFSNPDGTLFHQGPCCGETGGPSFTRFLFVVMKTESGYAVMDLPPYVP